MQTMQHNNFRKCMYLIVITVIGLLLLPTTIVTLKTYSNYERTVVNIKDGNINIGSLSQISSKPVNLNGEWHVYEGVYIEQANLIQEKIADVSMTTKILPETDLDASSGTRTYQLKIDAEFLPGDEQGVALAIQQVNQDIRVYFNGKKLVPYTPIHSWMGSESLITLYKIQDAYDYNLDYQDILISVNSDQDRTDLYRREITISTVEKFLEQTYSLDVIQGFFIGLMILGIIMGIVYIVIMPTYSVLTFMNLFDTTMMLSILYSASTFPKVVLVDFLSLSYGDAFIRGQVLMFLFISGFLGNVLSQVIYDKELQAPACFWKPINIAWCSMAVFFGIQPRLFNVYMIWFTIALLFVTFIGMLLRMRICYKSPHWNNYYAFHVYKTLFLGMIIAYDICTLNTYPRNNAFIVINYSIFFLMHFFIRAYEYSLPIVEIEKHNENLEVVVAERTEQLSKANEVLREMNIKDSLTKCYNRLYFEELLISEIAEVIKGDLQEDLHLCIFDLDNFKRINDTFGHSVGDDQLTEAIQVLLYELPSEVVISRIGGEEFTLLFKGLNNMMVVSIVEHARHLLEKLSEKEGRTTGSFGVTKLALTDTKKDFFIKADQCLYHAKENGKNCVSYNFYGEVKKYDKKSREL